MPGVTDGLLGVGARSVSSDPYPAMAPAVDEDQAPARARSEGAAIP